MTKRSFPRLLWISPGAGLSDALVRRLRACVKGGLEAFQLREKASFARDLANFAPELRRAMPRDRGVLLINDRVDVCLAAEYDGVQLGQFSLRVEAARSLLGPEAWIGASVHDERELDVAQDGGADYVLASPIYPVRKRGMPPASPLGLVGLAELCARARVPVLALGGVRVESVTEVLDQGAHGVAVMSAIAESEDPRAMVEKYLGALAGHES